MSGITLAKTFVRGWAPSTADRLQDQSQGEARETSTSSPEEIADASYREFAEPLFRFLVRRFGHEADAEEVVQETFLRAYRELQEGRHIHKMGGWVHTTAFRLMIDRMGARRMSAEISLELFVDASELFRDGGTTIEQVLADEARAEQFRQAFVGLTPLQRECITLRAQGRRLREIAELLNMDYRRVAEALARAIVNLRRLVHD